MRCPIILTIVAILASVSSAQPQTPKQMSVNGTTITYVDEGTGPMVLFVHGAYSDHRVWEAQREVVTKGYRYVVLDLRYFGTAPWSDDGKHFNVATHAADVAAFIRALKVGPIHLVGRSYGAITSLAAAAPRITCAQLGEIKVPVEITIGDQTRTFYRITVGAVHRCIPSSCLITI